MKKIVIDSGHGGNDSGAVGNNIVEKEYTLMISKYIHNRLDELGIDNKLVRVDDETIEPNDRVQRIVDLYGNDKDVVVISNHINAGGGEGAEIIYALRNNDNFSKKISNELENIGRNVRKYYQRRYPSDSSKDYYFIHRNTGNTEAVIIEYGFLDNVSDADLLKKYWKDYAEAVVKAICDYIGVSYSYAGNMVNTNYYIVKKGDSLYSIGKQYNISVDKLIDINNLKNTNLSIGQKLLIKDTSYSDDIGLYYKVKSGDTLYSIAKLYKMSVDELKKLNNLNTNNLQIGQMLLVGGTLNDDLASGYYIVKSGDTLWSIAHEYNVNVSDIKTVNNLKDNMLKIGQKLVIPKNNKQYVVKNGDTLYSIAKKFDTSVTDLVNKNDLSTINLKIGQVLYIP